VISLQGIRMWPQKLLGAGEPTALLSHLVEHLAVRVITQPELSAYIIDIM